MPTKRRRSVDPKLQAQVEKQLPAVLKLSDLQLAALALEVAQPPARRSARGGRVRVLEPSVRGGRFPAGTYGDVELDLTFGWPKHGDIKRVVCEEKDALKDVLDKGITPQNVAAAIAIIGPALGLGTVFVVIGAPIVALIVWVAKVGLDEFCRDYKAPK
jgi:hypothetical protein